MSVRRGVITDCEWSSNDSEESIDRSAFLRDRLNNQILHRITDWDSLLDGAKLYVEDVAPEAKQVLLSKFLGRLFAH